MNKILLLPGTDAIEHEEYRRSAASVVEVYQKVKYTQNYIKSETGEDIDLVGYMSSSNDVSVTGFRKLVLCSLATQVALCEKFEEEQGQIYGVMGLSLGDVARSVVCGICTYEDAVRQLLAFTAHNALIKDGFTLQIKMDEFDTMESLELESHHLELSIAQNDRFFLVAGSTADILSWTQAVAMPKGIRFRPLYPFPLHSSLMRPVADAMADGIRDICDFKVLKYKVFSTVFATEISLHEDIVTDCRENIASTLRFTDTIKYILKNHRDATFVNIGPAPTLKLFIEKMVIDILPVQIMDYFDDLTDITKKTKRA